LAAQVHRQGEPRREQVPGNDLECRSPGGRCQLSGRHHVLDQGVIEIVRQLL
jgi:hypothetical protein